MTYSVILECTSPSEIHYKVTKNKIMTHTIKTLSSATIALLAAGAFIFTYISYVHAGHNGAVVETETAACGETTITASVADPNGTHLVSNMWLVVHADGETQSMNIPTDGSDASITVGPFFTQSGDPETVRWNVFGGAERAYDQPLWNGYGDPDFGSNINAYAAEQGGFGWVLDGPDEPNPFTNWNEIEVDSCAVTKDMCKQGGWENLGFSNQGQCIRYVNTGQDSR